MRGDDIFYNTLGVIGAVLLLFGFYRVTAGKWNNKSLWYELDNIVGAGLIIAYQLRYHAYVTVVVNFIWALIAVGGLVVFFRRYAAHRRTKKTRG